MVRALKTTLSEQHNLKPMKTGKCEPYGKETCLVCNSISARSFTTKAFRETFKTQSGPLNCNSEKVPYLLICKVCGEPPYVEKTKSKFRYRFNNYKRKTYLLRKYI